MSAAVVTTAFTTSSSSSQKNSEALGSRKRKRSLRRSIEVDRNANNDLLESQSRDYYNRLLYQCRKVWNKQVKAIKKLQVVKMCKRQSPDLKTLKSLSVESVVQEAIRRLGIFNLDPDKSKKESNSNGFDSDASHDEDETGAKTKLRSVSDVAETTDCSQDDDDDQVNDNDINNKHKEEQQQSQENPWIEKILSHNRLIELTEQWNAEIAKYSRWYQNMSERLHQDHDGVSSNRKSRKNKSQENSTNHDDTEMLTYAQSVFCQLGNDGEAHNQEGVSRDGVDKKESGYSSPNDKRKKNRPGQRARKAKFEAQKLDDVEHHGHFKKPNHSGVKGGVSIRNRTTIHAKQQGDRGSSPNQHAVDGVAKIDVAVMSKRKDQSSQQSKTIPGDDANLHPSWIAQKNQAKGIVEFQGTKIKFDD